MYHIPSIIFILQKYMRKHLHLHRGYMYLVCKYDSQGGKPIWVVGDEERNHHGKTVAGNLRCGWRVETEGKPDLQVKHFCFIFKLYFRAYSQVYHVFSGKNWVYSKHVIYPRPQTFYHTIVEPTFLFYKLHKGRMLCLLLLKQFCLFWELRPLQFYTL